MREGLPYIKSDPINQNLTWFSSASNKSALLVYLIFKFNLWNEVDEMNFIEVKFWNEVPEYDESFRSLVSYAKPFILNLHISTLFKQEIIVSVVLFMSKFQEHILHRFYPGSCGISFMSS